MLILAGVSINLVLGPNGLITKAQEAALKTEEASEKEAIQLELINMQLGQNDKYEIGEELKDRTLANGNNWKIISVNKKIYGTGWRYIEKGTNIKDYGTIENSWLINEETNEVIQLPEEGVTKLAYGDNLGVKDGIILNVDPINMGDETSWGDGVTMYGVTEGDGFGFNGTEFKFDGVNDYIEVYTDGVDIDNGITFEFYCKATDDNVINMLGKTIRSPEVTWSNKLRMQFVQNEKIMRCCMSGLNSDSDWAYGIVSNKHWIAKNVQHNFQGEDGGYITVTADIQNNKIQMYWNGVFLGETTCSHEWMINGGLTDSSIPFSIGMIVTGSIYTENYSKFDLYACRLYNKVLTEEEVQENYNKTVTYHNLLIQNQE